MSRRLLRLRWYMVKDPMSHRQNAHRRLSVYSAFNFASRSWTLFNFRLDLSFGTWHSRGMSQETRMLNSWAAYFLELLLYMDACAEYYLNQIISNAIDEHAV